MIEEINATGTANVQTAEEQKMKDLNAGISERRLSVEKQKRSLDLAESMVETLSTVDYEIAMGALCEVQNILRRMQDDKNELEARAQIARNNLETKVGQGLSQGL